MPGMSFLELGLLLLLVCVGGGAVALGVSAVMALRRHRVERKRPRVASLVCLSLGLLLLAAYLLLRILEACDCYLYIGGRISQEWRYLLRFLIPLPLGVGIILFSVKKLLSPLTAALTVSLALVLSILWPLMLFGSTNYVYTPLSDPAGDHELVFLEKSYFLFGGDGDIYERTSPLVLRKLADYPAHDGVTPVRDGLFTIDWHDGGGTLRPHYGDPIEFTYSTE